MSVLPVIAKVFEMAGYQQLSNYVEENNITTRQAGFRKKRSTQTSLLSATDNWYVNMDNGLINGIIFLDIKKAFDCVDHGILIKKLYLYGVRRLTLDWFKSYLSNRSQICKINNVLSKRSPIKCGVPQDSILGPLLFVTYVKDLANCFDNVTRSIFADDTNLTTTCPTTKEL